MDEIIITRKYLHENPTHIFVFGDNTLRKGDAGAASLRNELNTYGFITKRYPDNIDGAFYTPDEYFKVFQSELKKLQKEIETNTDRIYLISRLGAGLANRFNIWENIVKIGLRNLRKYNNVKFLYKDDNQ